MKALFYIGLLFPTLLLAQNKSDHHVFLLNGGHDQESNMPRYYENMKSMYDAFRENNVDSKDITVLYGSGKVEDTHFPMIFKPAPLIIPTFKPPEPPKLFQIKRPPLVVPDITATNTTPTIPKVKDESFEFSLPDLFRGEARDIDGEAKKEKIKEKISELNKKMKPGDNLTLFITDHGDLDEEKNENSVNLWGEKMTTAELGEILSEIPESKTIRIITNICYGGGLNDLTKKNICVFANQEKKSPSYSESKDLDLYGQNLAFALKNKIDFDNDGTATYLDAHEYAISLENKKNSAVSSLDWFLLKTREQILSLKNEDEVNSALVCEETSNDNLKEISKLIQTFSQLKESMIIDDQVPEDRQYLLSSRLQRKLDLLKKHESFSKNETLELKIKILKKNIETSAEKWDSLSPEEQKYQRKRINLEAQQLKDQVEELESLRNSHQNTNLELDFIRYADKKLIEEYESIKRCLEYAY